MPKASNLVTDEPSSNSRTVVKQLRKHVLQFREGDYLGSEDDLLALVPVSRPTLRQAIRVLEHEQLLSVRRGINGGYYARRPTLDSVAASAALYLSDRHTALWDFLRVAEVLTIEVCRLASLSTNEKALARLRETLATQWSQPFTSDLDCQNNDIEFELLMLTIANNPALELYMRVNFRFGASTLHLRVFQDSMERREIWRQQRLRQGEAILNRDTELAEAYGKQHYKIMNAWFREILAADAQSTAD
jgi:DNA-binding FadR family transcriptional regulator